MLVAISRSAIMCVTEGPPDYQASDPPRRRWRLLVLILCISVILLCHGLIYRHLLPNQWRGDVGFWPIEWWHGALMLLAYATAIVLLVAKRRLGLLLITTMSDSHLAVRRHWASRLSFDFAMRGIAIWRPHGAAHPTIDQPKDGDSAVSVEVPR